MILVTGATGQLASLVLDHLRMRGARALGGSRTPGSGGRSMDFDDPGSLDLTGVDTLVLVSAGYAEDDVVVARHRAVIDAAVRDGVRHVVYTSLVSTGDHLGFALAHRVTEGLLAASGLAWTVLRNGLYADLLGQLLTRDHHGITSPFGDGVLAATVRSDLAEAAAVVAAHPDAHRGATYDLVGSPVSVPAVAGALGVPFRTLPLAEYRARLDADRTLLPFQPGMFVSIATSIRHGRLAAPDPTLERLIGRPPIASLDVAVQSAAASLGLRTVDA